ncbi:ATP-dependent nuclease [Nocardioides zeae]
MMVDGTSGDWTEHLTALHDLFGDENGPLPSAVGLAPLWWDAIPEGAPAGIVITLFERTTVAVSDSADAGWPFGVVVDDRDYDPATRTRQHLFAERAYLGGFDLDGEFARCPIQLDDHLAAQTQAIEMRANELLTALLADAPVLSLALGDEQDWFLGHSCKWSATRLLTDEPLELDALSFAERRWARTAISLSLASLRTVGPDPVQEIGRGIVGNPTASTSPSGPAAIWLLLDEPEKGLHRTAEARMGHGIRTLADRGIRTVLATHSPELLDREIGDIRYVRRRSVNGEGCVIPMARFDAIQDSLGLNPSDFLRRAKGFALVEGEHDREVLRGMVGDELGAMEIEILAVRGSTKLKTVVDSQFLYRFTDAVLFPILDGVGLPALAELWQRHIDLARTGSIHEVVDSLLRELRSQFGESGKHLGEFLGPSLKSGTFERVLPLGIPQSDVLECLPVAAFIPSAQSWGELRAAGTENNRNIPQTETQFKDYLKRRGADLSPERIRQVAQSAPHPDIKALVAAMGDRLGC